MFSTVQFFAYITGIKINYKFKIPYIPPLLPRGKVHELTFMCFIVQIAIFVSALTLSGNKIILRFSTNLLTLEISVSLLLM